MMLNLRAALDGAKELYESQRYPSAEKTLREVLAQDSANVEALTLLGMTFGKMGRFAEAERPLGAALALDPERYDALVWMGLVKKSQNQLPAAVSFFERALAIRSDDLLVLNHLGLTFLAVGAAPKSIDPLIKATVLDPSSVHAFFNLGMALHSVRRYYEAYDAFRRAIDLDPLNLGSYLELFNQVQHLLNWQEGVGVLERGLEAMPDSAPLMVALATTYGKIGRSDEARRLFQSAYQLDPQSGPFFAQWLQVEGQFDEANEVLKGAIRQNPTEGMAYYNLTIGKCYEVEGRSLETVIPPLISRQPIRPASRMYFLYALGKTFEHLGKFQTSMQYYDEANDFAFRLYNAREGFDPESTEKADQSLRNLFSKEFIERLSVFGSKSDQPIFIVGMIRSGTTLLDQIISSHPLIKSAGEQPFWQLNSNSASYKWANQGAEPEDLHFLAARYLEALEASVGNAVRITDKMPMNYQNLGLIRTVFPHARIIHIRRSPMDTALSIYTTYLGPATNFAYNQRNIVGSYKNYLKTMAHWQSVFPKEGFCEVDYESLVTDPEPVTRRLIEFCGLDWDEACLRHHEADRGQVSTPSLWTARQPINTGSVGRWQKFKPWLGELLALNS